MQVRDRLALIIFISLPVILIVDIVLIFILALMGKDIPVVLVDLAKTIVGAFIGYVRGVATAYFG